jgi:lipopolysaccharide/colanic/teichoic acid biosynthesis glycosyltransferase
MTGRPSHRSGVVKRGLKLVAATILLVSLAPVLVVLALFVRWRLGSAVLCRQVRPGLRRNPFTVFKFRSMRDAVGPDGAPLPDSSRLDSVGRRLRTSIRNLSMKMRRSSEKFTREYGRSRSHLLRG